MRGAKTLLLVLTVSTPIVLLATKPPAPISLAASVARDHRSTQATSTPAHMTPQAPALTPFAPTAPPSQTDLSLLLDHQERVYSATITRMEWLFNILVATIAVAGVLAALLGSSLITRGIERAVGSWLEKNASAAFEEKLDQSMRELREKYDTQFAELYRRIDDAFSKDRR